MCSDWGIEASDLTCNRQNLTADEIAAVIEEAVLFINDVTCGQFDGPCSTTIRPLTDCAPADACTCHGAWPRLDLYQWVSGPIVTVDQVSVDGEIVPADNYHLWEHRFLGPVDPDGSTSPSTRGPRTEHEETVGSRDMVDHRHARRRAPRPTPVRRRRTGVAARQAVLR